MSTSDRRPQVFILDDMPRNQRQPIVDACKEAGVELLWFANSSAARGALESIESIRPSIFLIDMVLGKDRNAGVEFCRWLQSQVMFQETPKVMLSAVRTDREAIMDALRAGCWDYLPKNVGTEVLVLKIELLLELSERIEEGRRRCKNAVVMVDATTGHIIWRTATADQALQFFFGLGDPGRLPCELYKMMGQLRSTRQFRAHLEKDGRSVEVRFSWDIAPNRHQVELFEKDSKQYTDFIIVRLREFVNGLIQQNRSMLQLKLGQSSNVDITEREAEVLFWFGEGRATAQVALVLNVEVETVRSHLRNIRRKICWFCEPGRATWVQWVTDLRRQFPSVD